ncbi:NAD(P)/FAD-dependent oxidoreductase [Actinoplanes sp. NPDC049548]|uniref:NAD(P)/FAD-dependent oxidoreductase n=1 Tax=Actinoplanes sp. NPDC049548 TaxID=3155152 RepID=UPI00343399C0
MTNQHHDTVIVGAGPAGLQLAYFLEKSGRDYLVVDAGERSGTYFEQYPRHRKLLSINKQYTGREATDFNLRHDWNCLLTHPGEEMPFKDFSTEYFPSADDLVDYLNAFRERFDLKVRHGFRVARISKDADVDQFQLTGADGEMLTCRRLVMAVGVSTPNVPDIPGIEHAQGYDSMSLDPEDYRGKTVLILGKGNSALETAEYLMPYASYIHLSSRRPVQFAWDTHFAGNVRSTNATFFDSYLLKSQNAVLDGPTQQIERTPSGRLRVRWAATHQDVEEEVEHFEYDHVLHCCGFRLDTSIFDDSCAQETIIEGRFPAMTGAWESSTTSGLYFAGVLMQAIDYKRSQSSFIHGFRYNVRTLFHLLENRYEGVDLPGEEVKLTPADIASKVIDRANNCSALWQMVGFLCDVFVLPTDRSQPGRWYHDLNVRYVAEEFGAKHPELEFYVSMLTYGPGPTSKDFPGTAFDHPHVHPHTSERAYGDLTTEIHPVLRRYRGSELQAEYHVKSDVLTDWDSPYYREPLQEFLDWDLMDGPRPEWAKPRRRDLIRNSAMRLVDYRATGELEPDKTTATTSGKAQL